ncbi:MAG TPA: rhodanese-like domain-containing protein [Vicinamibacterales bacterium]|nr:rhodanese-like domain-containing protein [Vicinamibacterales bacterium]
MLIRQIVDEKLAQNAYLIGCQKTGEAIVIDPERDVDRYIAVAEREGLRLVAAAETHIHADFLSGVRELARRSADLRVYLSDEGDDEWKYQWPAADARDAVMLRNGDRFRVGNIELRAWHTPGHTPEHLTFVVTDHGAGVSIPMALVTGDFLFVNDLGRPDLLESALGVHGVMQTAARRLYASARQLDGVDDYVQVWPGHGAGSACGKALGAVPTSTVGYERRVSPALLKVAEGEDAFVEFILTDQPEPPLYFAEMKRLNKIGPPVRGNVPAPPQLTSEEVRDLAAKPDVQVVDTRADRLQFFQGHLPGVFYAPFNKTFPTTIGSMLDAEQPLVLLVDQSDVDDAVRALVRIGHDRVLGWAPVSMVEDLATQGVPLATIESIDIEEFERRRAASALAVLDVRTAAEHAARHVPGAQNIAHTRLRSRLSEIDSSRSLHVHCGTGARAAASVALLRRRGHAVTHVEGAFATWQPSALTEAR